MPIPYHFTSPSSKISLEFILYQPISIISYPPHHYLFLNSPHSSRFLVPSSLSFSPTQFLQKCQHLHEWPINYYSLGALWSIKCYDFTSTLFQQSTLDWSLGPCLHLEITDTPGISHINLLLFKHTLVFCQSSPISTSILSNPMIIFSSLSPLLFPILLVPLKSLPYHSVQTPWISLVSLSYQQP